MYLRSMEENVIQLPMGSESLRSGRMMGYYCND